MKKLLAALALIAPCALAEDIIWSGDSAAACTFSNVVAGTLTVTGNTYATNGTATYDVDNNSPGTFQLTFPQLTTFSSAPGSADMQANAAQSIAATGANTGAPTGDDLAGYNLTLTNAGTDSIQHSVSGSIVNPQAGTYTITAPVSCIAL